MKFFLDNCLPPRIASALQELVIDEHQVVHLRDKFDQSVDDPTWLKSLGVEGGWIVVSGDTRIPKNPQNRMAWRESQLTAFFLKKNWDNQVLWERTWRLIKYWPRIMAFARDTPAGSGFWITVNGKFEPIISPK